jgi:PIN domain nuclease of toxin-antitoxin system
MKLLLDTCTFLWLTAEPDRLGPAAKQALDAEDATLILSDASIWEVCLKWSARKLELPTPPRSWLPEQMRVWQVERLPLEPEHFYRTTELPALHRDPFDRLLVSQAIEHNLSIVTPDPALRAYPVGVVW